MSDFKLRTDDSLQNSDTITGASTPSLIGEPIFKRQNGQKLEFKNIVAGTNITLTASDDNVQIDAAGGGGSTEEGLFAFEWVLPPSKDYLNGWYDVVSSVSVLSTIYWQRVGNILNLYTNTNMNNSALLATAIPISEFTTNIAGVTDTDVIQVIASASTSDPQTGEVIPTQLFKTPSVSSIEFLGNPIPPACTGPLYITLDITFILS
jgi:hypothetical protein